MRFTLRRFAIPIVTMLAAFIIALTTRRLIITPYLSWAADYVGYVIGALVTISILSTAYSLIRLRRTRIFQSTDSRQPCGTSASNKSEPQGDVFNS